MILEVQIDTVAFEITADHECGIVRLIAYDGPNAVGHVLPPEQARELADKLYAQANSVELARRAS